MAKILVSSNPENLAQAIAGMKSVTIEAEFGAIVVEGSIETRAHHVDRYKHLPSPCTYVNIAVPEVEAIGLSHLDLDSIGGTLAALGQRPGPDSFWQLAGFVDVKGPHRLVEANASLADLESLHAFWAWSEANRCYPPRDGSVIDVAEYVEKARQVLSDIFDGVTALIEAGREAQVRQAALNASSFVELSGNVAVRKSDQFTNHLYSLPTGEVAKAVVAFNTETGSITVSVAEPTPGVNCRDLVQFLWGNEAGGHAGIAGSPRGKVMGEGDLFEIVTLLDSTLQNGGQPRVC